jgi:type I restriction enzyme R subunit
MLLQGLAEKGFGHEQLAEMQKIIDAEKSDLFDVLAYVAYALPPLERAARAKVAISSHFNSKQQAFLGFVLAHYVGVGVDELDQEKLTPLLRLKYSNSIADAITDLGKPEEISKVVDLHELFDRMTQQELEAYARDGSLPTWFTATIGATATDSQEA